MGRHPDPRPGEDAAASSDEPVEPATSPRRSRLAGRLVAVGLTVLLGGWAAVAVAGAATAALASPLAAAVPTPAVITPSPATSASARATASTEPSPSASADASGKPPSAPKPPAPAPDGSAMARPRLTTTPIGTRLQAQLDRLRARLGIPGVSATIVFRDGTSWTGVSGLADVARKVPVADDTAFAVGSISKTYTAALILALAGDGKIGLDKPAASYLPGLRPRQADHGPDAARPHERPRRLLHPRRDRHRAPEGAGRRTGRSPGR